MAETKYPIKSSTYTGVYQRKNGTWFYRAKRIIDGKEVYYQSGKFLTDKLAHDARQAKIQLELCSVDKWKSQSTQATQVQGETFGEYFQGFINSCDSKASAQKYKALYTAQLKMWEHRNIHTIKDADIDILMLKLKLSTQKYSDSYIASIRKMLKKFFQYACHVSSSIVCETAQFISTKPYKLRVLSLFSGIGAPERALKNIDIDFELVGYCEFDDKASKAYSLLHNVDLSKDFVDVENLDFDFCRQSLPNFDLLIFGFPCQKISQSGTQQGMIKEEYEYKLPEYNDLRYDEGLEGLTESGLLYRALQVVMEKRPKFVIIENVAAFAGQKFKREFNNMLRIIQVDDGGCGYNVYFDTLNSKDYGIPQNRDRVFIVLIRRDLNIAYHFPDAVELEVRAEEWFEENAEDEYYIAPEDIEKLKRDSWQVNYKRDVISCITTRWSDTNKQGNIDAYVRQTLIKDKKGIRCLTSEELMRFQGFEPEDAEILKRNGYTKEEIGKLVGNSITVPVIKAVIEQLFKSLDQQIDKDFIPYQIIQAPIEGNYMSPLFAYAGNKYKLLPYLDYVLPNPLTIVPMYSSIFVDLFAGSGTIAMNIGDRADTVVMNDRDAVLIGIYKALSTISPNRAWKKVMEIVDKYQLSASNKEGYKQCRADYNKIPIEHRDYYWYWALAIIYHSYNTSTISYNKKGEINSSFGHKKCNIDRMKKKFFPFAEKLFKGNYQFTNCSFQDFAIKEKCMDEEVFYYLDPPYYVSTASYNKFWTEQNERELYQFLDDCSSRGERWVLSNALENNGERNEILATWLRENQRRYIILYMNRDYKHCSYNRKNKGRTIEVLVMNFTQN